MQTFFYNLAGGINLAASKTALGLDTKKIYWSDSKNIEILENTGIIRQNGNTLFFKLKTDEEIVAFHPLKNGDSYNFLIATSIGNLYVYSSCGDLLATLPKTLKMSSSVNFVDFLDGVICASDENPLFYINNDSDYKIEDCNLKTSSGDYINSAVVCAYGGRVWVGFGATLYYSALGKYNDFTTSKDAGYINNFYTDTNSITSLKAYNGYLAIYKANSVYLLSGTSNDDFKISPFADKGTQSVSGVVNVNNKQYFINQGIYAMEQAGLLDQIQLGDEISLSIKSEFANFDKSRFSELKVLHYESKNQIWFFIPYQNDKYFHTIWIYDYINCAWHKRVLPQNISAVCLFGDIVLTADSLGNIYQEDFGNTFNGAPISFMWKSPFLAIGDSNVKKNVEEFYLVTDETYDNNFNFSVYKNYDSQNKGDMTSIYSSNSSNLVWSGDDDYISANFNWSDDSNNAIWAIGTDSRYKAEISESNYSVQLCLEGNSLGQNVAVIGLDFAEIYLDE